MVTERNKTTLLKGKMLHIGNKVIKTLPYQTSTVGVRNISEVSTNNVTDGFDLRIAIPLFILIGMLSNELNKKTINKENMSFALIAGAIAVILYFKYSLDKITTNNEKDIHEEIEFQSKRLT